MITGGMIEGGVAFLVALAGAIFLFGQIKENAERNEEDIKTIKDMVEKYQVSTHSLLEKVWLI